MKLQAILSALLLAGTSALSMSVYAATEADKAQAADVQTDKPAAKKVEPHSHLQEKHGIRPHMSFRTASDEKSANLKADKDRSKHFHPRDGK
ncbi:MAG: hypothetical protein HY661_11685 [Betaproteobacteria bacterium]|nr:hypothetical protein [Betaproteobacteria bacterium]